MDLDELTILSRDFKAVPEPERSFFVQIAFFLDEIVMLRKLLIISMGIQSHAILQKGQNYQTLFLIRLLSGKLFEGWELFQKRFFGTGLSNVYENKFDLMPKQNLAKLKQYFSKSNPIHQIRNSFAFHYANSNDAIRNQVDSFPDGETFSFYRSQHLGNDLHEMAHVLLALAVLQTYPHSDLQARINALFDDIIKVGERFISVCQEILSKIVSQHLPGKITAQTIQIPDPPTFDELQLPYFVRKGGSENPHMSLLS